jgi:uncharacterized repeat protein (TIGR01451 family)
LDPCDDNNEWTEDTDVVRDPDVTIGKSDTPDPVLAGNEVTYTISFGNDGVSTATNVSVVDTLPAGLTFVRCEPSDPANQVVCDDLGGGQVAVEMPGDGGHRFGPAGFGEAGGNAG